MELLSKLQQQEYLDKLRKDNKRLIKFHVATSLTSSSLSSRQNGEKEKEKGQKLQMKTYNIQNFSTVVKEKEIENESSSLQYQSLQENDLSKNNSNNNYDNNDTK